MIGKLHSPACNLQVDMPKTCFVIGPIGAPRTDADEFMKLHIEARSLLFDGLLLAVAMKAPYG
jgi:hypothetical protein